MILYPSRSHANADNAKASRVTPVKTSNNVDLEEVGIKANRSGISSWRVAFLSGKLLFYFRSDLVEPQLGSLSAIAVRDNLILQLGDTILGRA